MSYRFDWPLTALAVALRTPGALVDGVLPCGLPVRFESGAPAVFTRPAWDEVASR